MLIFKSVSALASDLLVGASQSVVIGLSGFLSLLFFLSVICFLDKLLFALFGK